MQAQQLLHHSFELRLAASLLMAVGLFAVVKLATFIDAKVTAFAQREQRPATDYSVAGSTR